MGALSEDNGFDCFAKSFINAIFCLLENLLKLISSRFDSCFLIISADKGLLHSPFDVNIVEIEPVQQQGIKMNWNFDIVLWNCTCFGPGSFVVKLGLSLQVVEIKVEIISVHVEIIIISVN